MKLSNRALAIATLDGVIFQLIMVIVGHSIPSVKEAFAAGGMGISFVAGILYAVISTEVVLRDNIVGGLLAGGVCAFIGILVSCLLGDVAAAVLLYGTAASAVTGAMGGGIGRLFSSGRV
ncbi:MAG: hypothetical protein ACREK8_04990 [Gemmatimonadales bacterium]